MTRKSLQALASEFIGIAILAMTVVGSGIMAQYLTDDVGLQLLINAAATGAILWLIITLFASYGGAQFNPVVTAIDLLTKKIAPLLAVGYMVLQIAGAIVGTLLANLMFDLSALDTSETIRRGSNLYLSEVIATAGLILLIKILVERDKAKKIPAAVALWIFAAYFFTASTSFANPAITIGRIFTDTFAGISPDSALRFIPFQIIGGVIGYFIGEIFSEKKSSRAEAVKK
jgi:glycerol uptake facilitator-like aquaporin